MAQPHPLRVLFLTLGWVSLFSHISTFAHHPGWWDAVFAALARLSGLLLFASWFRKADLERKVPLHVYVLTTILMGANALRWSWVHYHPHVGTAPIYPATELASGALLFAILLVHDWGVEHAPKG